MQLSTSEKEKITKSWSDLIAALLKLAYQKPDVIFKDGIKDGEDVNLCLSEHFIESQITNISLYDQDGHEHKITSLSDANIPDNPKRVVITIDHMKMEYIPADDKDHERINITGQQYSFYSNDEKECYIAGREKAKAALNLAYAAQAMGWTEVDFGHTSDPIDRLFLTKACQHVGLNFGGEKLLSSVVPGTNIANPDYASSAAIIKAQREITKRIMNKDPANPKDPPDPADVAVNKAFIDFFESPESPLPAKQQAPVNTSASASAALGL